MINSIYSTTKELLQTENCVVWPNLGAFVVERKAARIMSNGDALAPVRFVSFNKKLKQSDGMLLNAIAIQQHITYAKAEGIYKDFVEHFTAELKSSQTLVAGDLGLFSYENGHLTFTSNSKLNLALPSDFSLSNFSLVPLQAEAKTFSISPKLKWAAVLAIPVLTTALWAGSNYNGSIASVFDFNKTTVYKSTSAPVTIPAIDADAMMVDPVLPDAYFTNTHSLLTIGDDAIGVENKEMMDQLSNQYLVVVGCFRSLDNADAYKNSISSEKALVAGTFKGLYRVSYGAYANRSEALTAMRELRNSSKFKNAWISKY